jgi:proteasome lid subunit RPN8/RPN11
MRVRAAVLADIERHAREAWPQECCGLLIGTPDEIAFAVRASNRAADPQRRYVIDPQDHFAAIRLAREKGLEVVGAYHSHPGSQPVPSETDRAEAFENFVFMIAGRANPDAGTAPPASSHSGPGGAQAQLEFVVRAWRLSAGTFAEVAFVCDP